MKNSLCKNNLIALRELDHWQGRDHGKGFIKRIKVRVGNPEQNKTGLLEPLSHGKTGFADRALDFRSTGATDELDHEMVAH